MRARRCHSEFIYSFLTVYSEAFILINMPFNNLHTFCKRKVCLNFQAHEFKIIQIFFFLNLHTNFHYWTWFELQICVLDKGYRYRCSVIKTYWKLTIYVIKVMVKETTTLKKPLSCKTRNQLNRIYSIQA